MRAETPGDAASPRIRVGLVGSGNSGRFYHLPLPVGDPRFDLRVVATSGSVAPSDRGTPEGVEWAKGWESVVERPDVELVVIALPHHLHFPVARAALEAGKHVLVEKPATVRTSEVDELIELAELRGLVLLTHHQRRWERDFQQLLGVVRSGELGGPWRVSVARSHQGPYRTPAADAPHTGDRPLEWARSRDSGGGVGRVIGPHPVDHLLALAGSAIETVSGRMLFEQGEDVEHWMGIDVRFHSGCLGHVEIFRRSGIAPPRFTVWGTDAMAVAPDGTRVDVRRYSGEQRAIEGLQPPSTLGGEIYDDFAAAISRGATPRLTAHGARRVVEVIELAEQSARSDSAPLRSSETAEIEVLR